MLQHAWKHAMYLYQDPTVCPYININRHSKIKYMKYQTVINFQPSRNHYNTITIHSGKRSIYRRIRYKILKAAVMMKTIIRVKYNEGHIGNFIVGIIFYCIGNSQWCLYNTQSKSEWLFNTQSRVQQADWLILENNEQATLNINMPTLTYSQYEEQFPSLTLHYTILTCEFDTQLHTV